jgi:xylan 1,4-beta-xylosidase
MPGSIQCVSPIAPHTESDNQTEAQQARADWERRIYRRLTDTRSADPDLALPAPAKVQAEGAVGHVRLDWASVEGAAGYLIERVGPDGEPGLLQHGGSDVPAVPSSPFADTDVEPGASYRYRIAAVVGADYPAWNWSEWISATALDGDPGVVSVRVDAATTIGPVHPVWQMIGSERLTQLRFGDDGHGNQIGAEFAEALRRAHDDLGATHVRAHAILHDDNHVVTRDADGKLQFDFTEVDRFYDQLHEIGLRPVVEISFMPAVIARDANETVFDYRGIVSPPRDWAEWGAVVGALARHLVDRYGRDEVAQWGFEVWNEPNLEVFWTGTKDEYWQLYDVAAAAIKQVDTALPVGGPSTAASEWVEGMCAHARATGVPLDFLTSHTYGNMPLDTRPSQVRHGYDIPTYWTEWGAGSTHFGAIHDSIAGAPFILSGYRAVQGRMDAVSYWVISDHFEELGRPPALFHNGFGLLTVGNLRKPRYWAQHLAAHQGTTELAAEIEGDGADVLVQAWATRHDDGTVDILVWNGTINGALLDGAARLDRRVHVRMDGLPAGDHAARLVRVDADHSNILSGYPRDIDWPDAERWQWLRERDQLDETDVTLRDSQDGALEFDFVLPLPGVARLRVRAEGGSQ